MVDFGAYNVSFLCIGILCLSPYKISKEVFRLYAYGGTVDRRLLWCGEVGMYRIKILNIYLQYTYKCTTVVCNMDVNVPT